MVKRSLRPFKRSELTNSEYLSALYDLEDGIGAMGDMIGAEDTKGEIETLRDEQEEKKSNMPDALQESDTGQILQDRYDALDNAVNEMDSIIDEYDSAMDTWNTEIEEYKTAKAAYDEQQKMINDDEQDEEEDLLAEPDLPENTNEDGDEPAFDDSEFLSRFQEVSLS